MSKDPKLKTIADRLSSTLFVAALAHGVLILGVTFTAGPPNDGNALPVLNVTLLVDSARTEAGPDDATLLADTSRQQRGRTEEGLRPTTALSADHPVTQAGDPDSPALEDTAPRPRPQSPERLISRSASDRQADPAPETAEKPAAQTSTAAALLDRSAPRTLAAELDERATLPDPQSDERVLVASPATRESNLAAYLDAWRRRVEHIGTANFPAELSRDAPMNPTLEVAIGSDGQLEEIIVRRSSGDRTLDQAALDILRLASPFEALPEAIRAEYDVLRFAYEWDFFGMERPPAGNQTAR